MTNRSHFQDVFEKLKSILAPYTSELTCTADDSNNFYLDTLYLRKNKTALFFGATNINKSYVSYHLMPVYIFPELLERISPELKRRMQGKSCFNFKTVDQTLFDELATLTEAGYQQYKTAGYL